MKYNKIKQYRAMYYSARKKHDNNIEKYLKAHNLEKDFDEFKQQKNYSYYQNYYRYFFISINKLNDYEALKK